MITFKDFINEDVIKKIEDVENAIKEMDDFFNFQKNNLNKKEQIIKMGKDIEKKYDFDSFDSSFFKIYKQKTGGDDWEKIEKFQWMSDRIKNILFNLKNNKKIDIHT